MKYFYLIFILFLSLGCKTNKSTTEESGYYLKDISCPDSGNCTFEVIRNSKLNIRSDKFGKLYPEVTTGDKVVIKFHYKKKVSKKKMDSGYSEFVYLEVNEYEPQLILKDNELQQAKVLFGRICFCRDATGYYRVDQGKLYLLNANGNLKINLTFKINKVPQIISQVNETIKY